MTYKAIIAGYINKYDELEQRNFEYYKGQASLEIAIKSAAWALDYRGKRNRLIFPMMQKAWMYANSPLNFKS